MGLLRKLAPIQLLAAAMLVALCWVIADSMREHIVQTGDNAPRFQVVTDRGKTITRSEFGGKLLVLNFWATWCQPCIEELPSLDALQRRFANQGLVVLGVSVDKNEKSYKRFLERAKVSFETARDQSADISANYGTFKYPETYIIDREGKVLQKHIGPQDWTEEELVKSIRALL
jgi:cytochrome c biogenesis protein CcmG, thiol:disulfide interchange protein DsbE